MWIPGFDGPDVGVTVPVADLDAWTGSRTVTKPRTFEGVKFGSVVTVRGADVQFRDCYFRPSPSYGLETTKGGSATLRNCTFDGFARSPAGSDNGIAGSNIDAERVLIRGFADGIKGCSDSTFTMCQVVRHATQQSDPHGDSVQYTKGGRASFRFCNLDAHWDDGSQVNSAVILKTDVGPIDGVTFDRCYLGGGNYTVYSRNTPDLPAPPTNITVQRCVFGPDVRYGFFSQDGTVLKRCNVDHEGRPL